MRIRPRRNRKNHFVRAMVQETTINVSDLIQPLFVMDGSNKKEEIASMPGQYRWSLDLLLEEIASLKELGIECISLFPCVPEKLKTSAAQEAYNPESLNQKAIAEIKKQFPNMTLMSDVALDPYNSDGHDGIVDKESGKILNDETLEVLAKMAVVQAQAGSDIIGPSDMMDGRVAVIRDALDQAGFQDVSIMSYCAKYASAFYGPFRDALDSAPKAGIRKPIKWIRPIKRGSS
jgi:porphobilinogen synthase